MLEKAGLGVGLCRGGRRREIIADKWRTTVLTEERIRSKALKCLGVRCV